MEETRWRKGGTKEGVKREITTSRMSVRKEKSAVGRTREGGKERWDERA